MIVTVRSISSIRPSALAPSRPSEIEIAQAISSTVTKAEIWVASSAYSHTAGPKPSAVAASTWKTITARQVASVNCAMLKTTLIAGRRRSMSSTTIGPTSPAMTRSIGVANSRPKTSGRSPSENEWALRRKCRCTTQRSAARKPSARPHHGRCTPASNSGRCWTGPASNATDAMTIAMLSDHTPPSADSRRRAPFPGDMMASSAAGADG